MRVTPLDIKKQEFKKVMRGLDSEEVYAFLNTVAEEYEAVLSDNKNLRERIVALEERLAEYKSIETNLRNTLLTAEKMTQEARENARREASLIVRKAEMEAEKAAEAIRSHTMQLRKEILELKKNKDNYIARLRTLIESHARMLESFTEDFAEVDKAIDRIGRQVEDDASRAPLPPRMNRDKITQDFGREPRDKTTWGEERRREEEPRPQVPRPASEQGGDTEDNRPKQQESPNIFDAPSYKTPPPQQPPSSDNWRGYEVRKEQVDWRSYVLGKEPSESARRVGPADKELDDALSSLRETAAAAEAPSRKPSESVQSPPEPERAVERETQVAEETAAKEETWSIEELRRNLSNLTRDEGHQD